MNKLFNITEKEPTKFQKFLEAHENFYENFNKIFSHGNSEEIIAFLENFYFDYPILKNFLPPLYNQLLQYGIVGVANEVARLYVEANLKISELSSSRYDAPLFCKPYRIEHSLMDMVQQAAFIKIARESEHINQKPVISFDSTSPPLPNTAFIPYLKDSFEVIKLDRKERESYTEINPISSFFYKFTDQKYGCAGDFFHDCHNDLAKKGISSSPFKLKDITIEKALKFLKDFDFNSTDDFILLYLNEHNRPSKINSSLSDVNAFYNMDPSLYIDSIKYLLARGLKVIFVGNEKSSLVFESYGFINLSLVKRPGEVDIFLSAKAKFYFGNPCGPYHLASAFGTPCCLTHFIPYGGVRKNNFIKILQFKYPKTDTFITLKEVKDLGLLGVFDPHVYEMRGLKAVIPKQEENVNLVSEMLEYLEEGACFRANQSYENKKSNYNIVGGIFSDDLSLFD